MKHIFYLDILYHLEEQVDHPIAASGVNNNIETSTRDTTTLSNTNGYIYTYLN
jgi:hypothetical protein